MPDDATFRAAFEAARAATGPLLLTANAFDAAAMTVRRLWSSDPAAYPVGGTKPKRDTPWGTRVLLEGRVFVGEDEDAIRAHFADHATILGLGLRSVVNVPVTAGGAVAGVLNLLWPDATVPPDRVALAERLARDAAPAFGPPPSAP